MHNENATGLHRAEYAWHKLREERNGVFKKGIDPPPAATDWFHARIVVEEKQIKVYVNNAETPSLTVDKLNSRRTGKIGLWNNGLESDFANLVIAPSGRWPLFVIRYSLSVG